MINLHEEAEEGAYIRIKDAASLSPFDYGVEYNSPARGTWNIVHVGMLIPESHQIFVCAEGCLRGVVLTAAEMGAMDRFSMVTIQENNVLEGDMEKLMLDGIDNILKNLPKHPKAILVYTSCIHHFMATDLRLVYQKLSEKYKNIDFVDCYMNPIMRKSKLTPDATMRRQMYRLLKPAEKKEKQVNLIGNNTVTDDDSELIRILTDGGYIVRDICRCNTYQDFMTMSESQVNISFHEVAKAAGEDLQERLGQEHLYLPSSYDYKVIRDNLTRISSYFHLPLPDYDALEQETEEKINQTAGILKDIPIAIDYTAVDKPLGLAKLLISHGFHVVSVFADHFSGEEQDAFDWLKQNADDLKLYGTVHWKMRVMKRSAAKEYGKLLAIGQKAAYFTGTEYFVNLVENDGCFGYHGIRKLMDLMVEAASTPKDTRKIIQVKGWGCCA